MADQNLFELGVTATDVNKVEDQVIAEAEQFAKQAEVEEFQSNLNKIDEELQQLQNQHKTLSLASFSTKRLKQLEKIQQKISNLEEKRTKLLEANDAREELKNAQNTKTLSDKQYVAVIDDKKYEGESERDFLIRTGRVTPFQGQQGYERRHTNIVGPIRNKIQPQQIEITPASDSKSDRTVSKGSTRKKVASDDEEDYAPDSAEEEDDDDDDETFEIEGNSKKRKYRTDNSLPSDVNGEQSLNDEEMLPEEEGDDWILDDSEEVEFDGGLKVPSMVYDRLFDYQKTGVQWMWELHSQGTGGLLGDEMGLGKTVQIVAFLAALNYSNMLQGSVIVLAPATVLRQWYREFRRWWPRFRVRILHHSSQTRNRTKGVKRKKQMDAFDPQQITDEVTSKPHGVLITSYEQVRKNQDMLLDSFEYVIADEGHKLKSPDAEITITCKKFNTPHRVIVSGSPLQNHLKELWSLFDFVYPGKLGTLPVFHSQFVVPITIGGYSTASKSQVHTAYKCSVTLKDLIAPYLLRRLKKDVAQQLPEKNEQILFVKLCEEQREKYKKFLNSRIVRQVLHGQLNLLFAITALRKICNHYDIPLYKNDHDRDLTYATIREKRVAAISRELRAEEDEIPSDYGSWKRSGKMIVLNRVLTAWREAKNRVLLFSQTRTMLDILEKFVTSQGYNYLRMDGETSVGSRMELIDRFNRDEEIFVFLLTTRVGGLGVNLTGADRVILFDPDWNPSTDLQARERAWRVGQKKPVTIYRFITSGTIEEKIYHRQIYKQFLTNKVLSDPRQRRFFKQKDIKDIFNHGDDEEKGTETGDIFLGTKVKEMTKRADQEDSDPVGEPVSDQANGSGQDQSGERGNANLLNSLLDGSDAGLHSTINHDDVLGAGTDGVDTSLIEHEAQKIAKEAMEEVQRSARRRQRQSVALPTWTGKSGIAGLVRSSTAIKGGVSQASALLQRLRQKEGPYRDASLNDPNNDISTEGRLLEDIIEFLKDQGGKCSSQDVVNHFQDRVEKTVGGTQRFKALLKKVALLDRGPGRPSVWKLRPNMS